VVVDFDLPAEIRMIRDVVHTWVEREMIPLERTVPPGDELPQGIASRLRAQAKDLGLWALDVPEAFGGQGMGLLTMAVVWEELARTTLLPERGGSPIGDYSWGVLYSGTPEQQERWLKPLIAGDLRCAFAQTEPNAGSDPGSMSATAARRDGGYVLNGRKLFISNAAEADFIQVFALTDREKRQHGGVSCFIVERGTPGLQIVRKIDLMVEDRPCEVVLDNVFVPESHRVGAEGEGFVLAQKGLVNGRIKHGARAVGRARRALELAIDYARQRSTFGRPLADRQAIQWMIVDSATDMRLTQRLVWETAWRHDRGEGVRVEAAMCKMFGDEMAFRVIDRALQIHGGMGLSKELPLEHLWRQQRSMRITEGATEVQKWFIARAIFRDGWRP
jgi:acyl-CoA dehydrogenase